jgi:hypothetical protein
MGSTINNTPMIVFFKNNTISIDDISSDDRKKIFLLWEEVRENYSDWVADFRLRKVDNKTIAESLEWRGISTWWISPLVARDSEQDNRWLHRLMILFVCKKYINNIEIRTDDKILKKSIGKNFSAVKVIDVLPNRTGFIKDYIKYNYPVLLNTLRLLRGFYYHLEVYFILLGTRRKQSNELRTSSVTVWFRSTYPANWVRDESGFWMDRHIRHSPRLDKKYNNISGYLIYVKKYTKDFSVNFIEMWKRLRSLKNDAKRDVFFPEAYLSFLDIISCYYSSFRERGIINRWKNSKDFLRLFLINNIDVSDVLLDEWCNAYFHKIQYNKLHSFALVRFFSCFTTPQTIVTYGEFFVQSRYAYYAVKRVNPGSKFVSIQHAMNVKNKMSGYYKKNEFLCDDDNLNYSPRPDYYLSQGDQYSLLLKEFFSNNSIIIGCLKYDIFKDVMRNKETIKRNLINKYSIKGETVVVLAPSIDDAEDIFVIIKELGNIKQVRILLSPHPATSINNIQHLKNIVCPDIAIEYVSDESIYNLLTIANLVVCGYSTVAIEAGYFGVQAVRTVRLGGFPQFDQEELIPSFSSSDSFIRWYKKFNDKNDVQDNQLALQELAYKYFYKIDGKSADRMWNFLNSTPDLPHNKNKFDN